MLLVYTEYNDEENNLRYIVNDDRTLSVKGPIDSELADWVCIIPEEYEGIKVTSIGKHAFLGCSKLASITIPGSVTSIGSYAFYDCYSLTSITVSDNNKYYKSIDGVLFDKNVQKIIAYPCGKSSNYYAIPDSVTSIGGYAFLGCSSLKSITIPGSVISIGEYGFSRCSKLTSITIPDSVTSIGGEAFRGCSGLTSITIPDSVTSIGDGAFTYCSRLTEIHINKPKDTISGSPWGAPDTTIIKWKGEF